MPPYFRSGCMGTIDAENVYARFDEFPEHFRLFGSGPEGSDYLGFFHS
jgi:hypothetical protein